ncbi:MAG: hypothetical protein KJ062_18820, partial [Thermoanaerobaculia bacterium]|nr:hypothetical protein [Thermoanaerobaculia bacterium]
RGIRGPAGALLVAGAHRLDREARRGLGRIDAAAHRGGRLIEALLRLAALSRAVVVRGPVDLSAMAASIAADLEEEDPDRRVMWALTPGLTANADGLLVREVLENLIRNAWKFTGEGPGNRIELGASRKGGETIFHVRDDGAGFDMAHSSSLFRVFHRAHPPDSFPGLGIGLALVEKIVRRHEGWVRASGLPGGGATFSFTLEPPAGPGPAGDSRAPAA